MLHATLLGGTVLVWPLYGYLGPGGGISALGSLLALLAAIVVALFGFVWFPAKRLLRLRRRGVSRTGHAATAVAAAELEAGQQP